MELSGEAPRVYVGYDEYEQRDYLLSVFPDGTFTIAVRPGYRDTATTWSRPVELSPQSAVISE